MTKKQDIESMMEQTQQPFNSPAFDTFTAAWAVSQRRKKAAETTDRAGPQSTPDTRPDRTGAVENDPEVLRRKTENMFHGPVLDTFTAAWAASKDKIKTRPTPRPDNEHIVRRIYTHLCMAGMQGDLTPVLQPLADNVEWQSPGPETIPWAGTVRGRKQVVRWFATRGKAIQVEQFVPKEFITQGNQVIVMGEERSRVKATGKSYDVAVMAAWTLLNGVVTHYREAYDTATVLAALQNG